MNPGGLGYHSPSNHPTTGWFAKVLTTYPTHHSTHLEDIRYIVSVPKCSTDPADQNEQAASEQDPVADPTSEAGAGRIVQAEGPTHPDG